MLKVLAAAEGQGGFNPFEPQWGLVVWTAVALTVVFYFLAKKVFPTLEEGLADREQKIKGEIEAAENLKKEAEKILADYKSKVANAREEAAQVVEEARAAADSVRKELIARAEGDARLIVDKARKQLVGERERTLAELEGQIARWATDIAGQIVQKELTPDSHKDLIDRFIAEVAKPQGAR
ncbi:MAG: F0F1 ATP synthase subunit B [Actinomycetota bacterium]